MDKTARAARTGAASAMRRKYGLRLGGRLVVVAIACYLYFTAPQVFCILEPGAFLSDFSPLHLLWLLWMGDMFLQMRPARGLMALGSQKQFGRFYRPVEGGFDREKLNTYVQQANAGAIKVALVWGVLTALIGVGAHIGVLQGKELALLAVLFYLCDLICVLVWCPFQTFWMKNKCCTTCRIFNWDHLMMFSPFAFQPGFFAKSLFWCSAVIVLVWEVVWHRHPEWFWEGSNQALKCRSCTDRLCGR